MAEWSRWTDPSSLREFLPWPHMQAGHLIEGHAAWRNRRPLVDDAACKACMACFLLCPDAAIQAQERGVSIDYDLCKGCGVCAKECRHDAIRMEREP